MRMIDAWRGLRIAMAEAGEVCKSRNYPWYASYWFAGNLGGVVAWGGWVWLILPYGVSWLATIGTLFWSVLTFATQLGGWCADRFSSRSVAAIGTGMAIVAMLCLLLAIGIEQVGIGVICAVTVLWAIASGLAGVGAATLLKRVATAERAAALQVPLQTGARLVGAAFMGLLLETWGGWACLAFNALVLAIAIVCILRIDPGTLLETPTAPKRAGGLRHALTGGLARDVRRHVASRPALWIPLAAYAILAVCSLEWDITASFWAGGDPAKYAALGMIIAGANLVGSLLGGAFASRCCLWLMVAAVAGFGATKLLTSLQPSWPILLAEVSMLGIAFGVVAATVERLSQQADGECRGRVLSLFKIVTALPGVLAFVGGLLAAQFGVIGLLRVGGWVALAVAAGAAAAIHLTRRDDPRAVAA